MSRIAAMEFILGAYSPSRAEGPCRLITTKPGSSPHRILNSLVQGPHLFSDRLAGRRQAPVMHHNGLRSLLDHETVQNTDVVEDLGTGTREPVGNGYYGFLRGYPAGTAKKMPDVHDVLRAY